MGKKRNFSQINVIEDLEDLKDLLRADRFLGLDYRHPERHMLCLRFKARIKYFPRDIFSKIDEDVPLKDEF